MEYLICCSKKWFFLNCKNSFKKKKNIRFIFKKEQLNLKFLKKYNPRIIFFPHWSYFISSSIYANYTCVLFHSSNLPYGRGGSPIQNLILKKIKRTHVCAIKPQKQIDTGDIYMKKKLNLHGSLNEIFLRITKILEFMILKIIKKIPKAKKQSGKIVKFKRISNKESKIKKNISLNNLYDKIRMLDHDEYPRAFIKYGNLKIQFSNSKKIKNKLSSSVTITKN